MILDTAKRLAEELHSSEEYSLFSELKRDIAADASLKSLLDEYRRMQVRVQAGIVSGKASEEDRLRLQKTGELLQMDPRASAYLIAEYRLNCLLSEVYRILGAAVDVDLSVLEG